MSMQHSGDSAKTTRTVIARGDRGSRDRTERADAEHDKSGGPGAGKERQRRWPFRRGSAQPKQQIDSRTVRRAARAFVPYWREVIVVLAAIVVESALGIVNPYMLKFAIQYGFGDQDFNLLSIFVGVMIVTPVVTSLIGVGQTYVNTKIGQQVMRDLRMQLYAHLQLMPLRFFTNTKTGEIQSRLQNDVNGVQDVMTNTATNTVSNLTIAVSTMVGMLFLSWQLTLLSLGLLPIFLWLIRRVGRVRRSVSTETQESLAALSVMVQETLSVSGVLLTKTFGRQRAEIDRFSDENERLVALQIKQQMVGRWLMMLISTFFSITPALVYLLGGYLAFGPGHHTNPAELAGMVGTLVAFTTLQSRLFFPIGQLLQMQVQWQGAFALFDRIYEYLDLPREIEDKPDARALDPHATRGEVTFEHVTFSYRDDQERPTLDDVSFAVQPGQLTALVGPSGAGKTTITYLVPRLYDVNAVDGGAVRIDGQDVRDVTLESLGEIVGMVTQETYLFHTTIRENLRYARPDATDGELERAARAAAIHERIMELPEGYDTVVGERGYKLSGGEKQRIAIARVVLKDARILILDEATSALDTHSERLIQQAVDHLLEGRTTIAIAHRLSTILAAAQILVVDHGRVVERGTHAELLAQGGLYARLYHEQFGAKIEEHPREISLHASVPAESDAPATVPPGRDMA